MGKPLLLLFTFIASSYCNSIPVIDSMSIIPVNEDLQEGDFAFQILAHDDDNDPLTYSIKGQYSIHFNVNNTTGEVRIASRLDREVKDVLPITLVVNDGVYADETKNVHVAVQDANDNAPQFVGLPYNLEVPENLTVGSTIFTAGATDADFGTSAVVSYKIVEVVPNDGTEMFDISVTKGDIILRESFNFTEKSPFYQIRINASDGGGLFEGDTFYIQSTIVTAFLTIKDVPDLNPQFLNLPNSATVDEKSPVGTPVFTVKARDPDTGINDKIRYSIESELDLFQINEDTGIISVKTEFDRENLSETIVELKVKANETQPNVNGVIASTLGKLQITIGDINDNGPDFYKCDDACNVTHSFTGSVDENPSAGVSVADLQITVKDPDQGENHAKFNLRLEGDDKDAFSVNPSSGVESSLVQVIIKNPTAIDFEKKPTMIVQIVATDANGKDFSSTATVTININDLNDNFPKFENDTYTFSINEHCEVGTVVATITATDADALDDGKITYHLVPPSMLDIFGIFEHNGTIYVKDRSKLDREITSSYSPTLQAKDSDGKISTTVVEIKILDINDQTPEMNRDIYEVFVDEDKDFRLQIQARDGDEPETPNSEIQYSIEDSTFSSNFSIDQKTGLLVNNGLLDREAIDHKLNGEIELTVIASDKGTPSRSSNATVKVNIGDVNDNSPKFLDNSYTFKVKESEKGILVGSVRAHDADQTDFNNRIFFNIIDGSFGSFIIYSEQYSEGYRGNITVDPAKELDYESEFKSFTLEVEASDLDKQKTVTTVEVEVLDVNDTPPKFPAGLTLTVKENTSLPGSLSTIEGTDVDTLHSLDYELISSKCRCNGTTGPCPEEWFMVGHNGDVTVNSEYVIDYEACDQVSLTARVIDLLTEKGSNSSEGVVTINIEDINDNAPEFIIIQEFYVVLLERVEKGSAVAKVYAYDRDTGNNRKTEFKVVKVEFINSEGTKPQDLFFYADSGAQEDSLGIFSTDIRSQKSMDSNQRGKFRVEVEASNPDGVSSTSVVELLTVDTSYRVSLRFRSSVSEVNANLAQIRGILTGATKATVHIFNVFSEAATRAEEITVLEAYFVFPNGTALNYDDVNTILNSEEVYVEYGVLLVQLGFTGISTTTEDKKEVKPEVYIMIGLVAALAIVLVVTTTSLVFIRRNYKRKLKASKAMNSAATVVIENQKTGPVVPGTNKYTKEGANPVLNMNIDTATDLGFDEDGSSADRESLNSLDYNIDMAEKDSMPMMVIEEEDEDEDRESPYIEPLGAALAQRGENRGSDSPSLIFENPSMNTTDL